MAVRVCRVNWVWLAVNVLCQDVPARVVGAAVTAVMEAVSVALGASVFRGF